MIKKNKYQSLVLFQTLMIAVFLCAMGNKAAAGTLFSTEHAINDVGDRASVTLKVKPVPVTTINGPLSVCVDATEQYTTGNAMTGYTWSVTGGNIEGSINNKTIPVKWNTVGIGTIEVSYSRDNCTNTASVAVVVNPKPVSVPLQIAGKTSIDRNTSTTLSVETPVAGKIHWYDITGLLLEDGYRYTTPNLLRTTTYSIRVQNSEGCESDGKQDVTVDVLEDGLLIPEAITPNNDGYNDTWIIQNIEKYPNNRIAVYNRWGDKVYQTNGYTNSQAWDAYSNGTLKVGSGKLPRGTYFYQIELNDGSGRVYKGYLEIVY